MNEISYMSAEGLEQLKKELHHLKTVERPSLSKQIAEARDKGDLSENAEYDAAKEAQGLLEMKISKMQTLLANSRVLDMSKVDVSKVAILSTVHIKNLKTNTEHKYTIVSEKEADIKQGKISQKSAIGSGLLGKLKGDTVEITVPAGIVIFEILEITRE